MGLGSCSSCPQGKNVHPLSMEDLGLINPSIDSGENVKHGEDHGGDFLVKTQREILNKGAIFLDPGFE